MWPDDLCAVIGSTLRRPKLSQLAGDQETEKTSLKSTKECVSLSSPSFQWAVVHLWPAVRDECWPIVMDHIDRYVPHDSVNKRYLRRIWMLPPRSICSPEL